MNHRPVARISLLAAAAAIAAPSLALAQSNVTIGGLLDMSVGETKPPGGTKLRGVDSGKMTTSWWGMNGTEDLGGGLSAQFVVQSFMRADTGASGRFNADTFWARNAWLGVASKEFGRISLGRHTTPLFVTTLSFNPFGDSFGYSPSIRHYFSSGTVTGDSGWSDSVMYTSPNLGGAVLTLIGAAAEGGTSGRNSGATLRFGSGSFDSAFSWQDVKKDGTTAVDDTRTWQGNLAYDFGALKLFGQLGNVDNRSSGIDYDIAGLGASVPIDLGKLLAQWGRIKPATGAKRTTITIGYDYYLSRRTDVYLVGMSDKVDGLSSGSGFSVGLRHRF